jgi:hypothetical protein
MGTILRCFGEPSSIRIPGSAREIGDESFSAVSSLVDLSFEEGVERIGIRAFWNCSLLKIICLPASLLVIDESAFDRCGNLSEVTSADGSKLECIRRGAFVHSPLKTVVLPSSAREIDPFAFSPGAFRIARFNGPAPFLINEYGIFSTNQTHLLRCFSREREIVIAPHVEVTGHGAFDHSYVQKISFEKGSRLRELGEGAFSHSTQLAAFVVPSSVEIIGDRCFENCSVMSSITFEEMAKLKRIGVRAFSGCQLNSITIPASTEEVDGSAFVDCRLIDIRIESKSQNFMIDRNMLMTSDGTSIVRYFGSERKVHVPKTVEVLGKSCFESCNQLEGLFFESGSKLRQIGRSALSGCELLTSIVIPASVEVIDDSAFKKCDGLEECLLDENGLLFRIGNEAFAECRSLASFDIPRNVEAIGRNCFINCIRLSWLKFFKGESLKQIVGDVTVDEALENIGFTELSNALKIEISDIDDGGAPFEFGGWSLINDEDSYFLVMADI